MDMDESSTYRQPEMSPIDRLFLRMASLYGKLWLDMWAGLDMGEIKGEWQDAIQAERLGEKAVFRAVDVLSRNLGNGHELPPTLPRFVQLCKAQMPKQFNKALPRHHTPEEQAANQERIKTAVAEAVAKPRTDHKSWARKILGNQKGRPDIAIRLAQEALGEAA